MTVNHEIFIRLSKEIENPRIYSDKSEAKRAVLVRAGYDLSNLDRNNSFGIGLAYYCASQAAEAWRRENRSPLEVDSTPTREERLKLELEVAGDPYADIGYTPRKRKR